MSKITIEFKLPEDREDFDSAIYGTKYRIIIQEMFDWLRTQIKYQNIETLPLQDVRDKFWEIVKEHEMENYLT